VKFPIFLVALSTSPGSVHVTTVCQSDKMKNKINKTHNKNHNHKLEVNKKGQ